MWASLLPILGGVALATTSELTQPNTLTLNLNPNPNPDLSPFTLAKQLVPNPRR